MGPRKSLLRATYGLAKYSANLFTIFYLEIIFFDTQKALTISGSRLIQGRVLHHGKFHTRIDSTYE